MNKAISFPVILTAVAVMASGCSEDYKPVPATQCGEVVKHSSKILGKFAKPRNEMLRQCQNASDLQRGCVLQATIVADLTKCQDL